MSRAWDKEKNYHTNIFMVGLICHHHLPSEVYEHFFQSKSNQCYMRNVCIKEYGQRPKIKKPQPYKTLYGAQCHNFTGKVLDRKNVQKNEL